MFSSTRPKTDLEMTSDEIRLEALASKGRVRDRLKEAINRHPSGHGGHLSQYLQLESRDEAILEDSELGCSDDLLETAPLN